MDDSRILPDPHQQAKPGRRVRRNTDPFERLFDAVAEAARLADMLRRDRLSTREGQR